MKNAGDIPIWTGRAGPWRGRSSPKMNFRDVEDLLAERGILVMILLVTHWAVPSGSSGAQSSTRAAYRAAGRAAASGRLIVAGGRWRLEID